MSSQYRFLYGIYSNKHRGAYKNFHDSNAALIQGRRLFEGRVYLKFGRDKDFLSTLLLFFHIKLT